jgi:hypothetical protein
MTAGDRMVEVHNEFAKIGRMIQWHLARHAEWGDDYWMHPAIRDEVDYEMYECAVAGEYCHWCGDRDECEPPHFPFGISAVFL